MSTTAQKNIPLKIVNVLAPMINHLRRLYLRLRVIIRRRSPTQTGLTSFSGDRFPHQLVVPLPNTLEQQIDVVSWRNSSIWHAVVLQPQLASIASGRFMAAPASSRLALASRSRARTITGTRG